MAYTFALLTLPPATSPPRQPPPSPHPLLAVSSVHATFSPVLQLDLIASDFAAVTGGVCAIFQFCLLLAMIISSLQPVISSSRQLVISSSSPSSYSQLNVHFSVKQAVKWHFRWRSSRRFVSFGSPGVRLLVWLLRAVPAFLYAA